jgi:nucleoside-diphosphate-sugar epimerase
VPALLAAGHTVTGMTRSSERAGALAEAGATPVIVDAFGRSALTRAVAEAQPDVVVNQLTALPQSPSARGMKAAYEANDRARGEGGANLLAATQAAGVSRYVTQSVAFFCRPTGEPGLRDEDTPLWTDAPGLIGRAARVAEQSERAALEAGGVVLRYGFFGGPGTWYDEHGAIGELVRKRRYPLIGDGAGVHSFIHVDDAAAATVAALQAPSGIYNVVDDHPAPTREWLPAFAAALGAPPPRHVPALPLKLLARALVAWQEGLEGMSNARAKAVLHWTPVQATWRTAFRDP